MFGAIICPQARWAPSPVGLIYAHISKKLSQTKNLPDTAYEAPPNARNHRKIGVSSAVVTSNREDVCIDEPYGRGSPPNLPTDHRLQRNASHPSTILGTNSARFSRRLRPFFTEPL